MVVQVFTDESEPPSTEPRAHNAALGKLVGFGCYGPQVFWEASTCMPGGRLSLVAEFPDREPVVLSGIAEEEADPKRTGRKHAHA